VRPYFKEQVKHGDPHYIEEEVGESPAEAGLGKDASPYLKNN
jgi:hypothetical protein